MKNLENIFDDLQCVIDYISEKINNYDERSGKPIATYTDMKIIRMSLEPLEYAIEDCYKKDKRG